MATANPLERIFSVEYKSKIQPRISVCKWGEGLENLCRSKGVTIDNTTGDIYVADSWKNCVKAFDNNGQIMFKFGSEEGEGKMKRPNGLAIILNRILITHRSNYILIYQLDGEFVSRIGDPEKGELEFEDPSSLTFDESNEEIFICDSGNNRIQILSKELTYKTHFGQDKLKYPLDIKLSKNSFIFLIILIILVFICTITIIFYIRV